jgi:hypothetical protein
LKRFVCGVKVKSQTMYETTLIFVESKLCQFIDYYHNVFNKQLIKDFKESVYGHMYVLLVNKNKDIHKIGIVKPGNPIRQRLKSYMVGNDKHPDIEFVMEITDPLQVEKCVNKYVNKLLTKNKLKGKEDQELFKVPFNKLLEAVKSCACISMNTLSSLKDTTDSYVIFVSRQD